MRKVIILHTALALFFLPAGLLYAITGALYGLGIKGGYETTTHEIALEGPLQPELGVLVQRAEAELGRLGISPPSGKAGVKKGGNSFFLEWTGTTRDIQLHPTRDSLVAELKVSETGVHRYFVQLHKAKGGMVFKIYAALWGVALVLIILSGTWMAFQRGHRRLAILSLVMGLLSFFLAALAS